MRAELPYQIMSVLKVLCQVSELLEYKVIQNLVFKNYIAQTIINEQVNTQTIRKKEKERKMTMTGDRSKV